MKPVEFVLWANGAAELIGDEPPTKEQWLKLREKLGEAVGTVVASKLLEKAEEVVRQEERARDEMPMNQMLREMQAQKMASYQPYYGALARTAASGQIIVDDLGMPDVVDRQLAKHQTADRFTFLDRFRAGLTGGKTS